MFYLPMVFVLLAACIVRSPSVDHHSDAATTTVNKTVLLQMVNKARQSGCQCGDTYYQPAPPVSWNDQLEAASLVHSADMLQNNYFGHTAPDGSNAGVRIENAGYHWKAYGENIGSGYRNEEEVISGWIKSPNHCKNIMNGAYKEMGVARAGNLWTQEFAAR
jgi:uncharacterized protein YkwD